MNSYEKSPAYLKAKAYDKEIIINWEDSDQDMHEMIHAFFSICVGLTFNKDTIINSMKEYVEEYEDLCDK